MEKLYNQLYKDGKYTKTFEDFQSQFGTPETSKKLYTALNEAGDYTRSFDDFKAQFNIVGKTSDPVNVEANAGSVNNTASESGGGSSELVDPDDFQNTQEKNTWLEDTFGKNQVTDFFGDFYRAGSAGKKAGRSVDEAFDLFKYGNEMTDEQVKDFLAAQRDMESAGQTDEMIAFSQEFNELKDKYGGIGGTLAAWWRNPSVMAQYTTQSLVQMANAAYDSEEVLGIAAAGSGAGAATGAAAGAGIGAFFGGVGAAPGSVIGAKAGAIGGFFGGLSGAMETGMTTAQLMQEAAEKEGLNWGSMTDDERFKWVRKLTSDKEAFEDIKSKAVARGITIGAIDGIVGAASGGVGGAAFRSVASGSKSALANAARVGAVATLETTGGMASEYFGQKAAGQEMNLEEIMIEGFADKTFTGISVGKALVQGAPKYSINGQTLNGREFNDALKMMDDEAYVSADIKVENSPAVERVVNNRRQNISIDQDIDSRVSDVNDRAELIKLEKQVAELKGNETVSGKNKLNNLKARIKEITSKYEGAEVDATVEQRKQAIAQAIDDKFEASFNKNLKAARGAAAKKGTVIDVFENEDSYFNKIAENQGITPQEAKSQAMGSDGVFVGDGQIFINKTQAKKVGAVSVASHEFLHPVLNAAIGDTKQQGKIVSDFKKQLTSRQRAYVENRLKANYDPSTWDTEYLNIFSDGIQNGDINYDQNLFEKIGEAIKRFFVGKGFDNISFDSGRDVYNFLKEYNTSIKQEGKVSQKAMDAITTAEQKTGRTVGTVGTAGSMQMSRAENVSEINQIYDNTPDKTQAGFEIAQKYRGMAESVFKQLRDGQNLTPDQQSVLNQNKEDIIAMMLYDKIPSQRQDSKARNVLGLVQDFVKEKQKYGNVAAYINTFFKNRSKEVTQYFIPDAVLEGMETQEGTLKKSVATKTADQKTTKPQGPKARKITSFEKLTIDGEEFYTPAMKTEVAKRVAANVSINARKGLNVNEVVKSIDEDVKTVIRDVIKKQMGKVSRVKGETVISPEYQNFLDQSYEMFVKSMPLSTIKRRYSKLFKLKKLGREQTAVGKGIFQMTKPTKQEFNTFFTKGGYTTLIERQKGIAVAMAEEFAANETSRLSTDQNFLEKIASILEISDVALVPEVQLQQLIKDIAKAQDRKVSEARGFDQTLQFSKTMFENNAVDNVKELMGSEMAKHVFKSSYVKWKNGEIKGNWVQQALNIILDNLKFLDTKTKKAIAKELASKHKELKRNIEFIAEQKGIDEAAKTLSDFIIDPDGNVSVGFVNAMLGIKTRHDQRNLGHINEGRAVIRLLRDNLTVDEFIRGVYQGATNAARLAGFKVKDKIGLTILESDVVSKTKQPRYSLAANTKDMNTNFDIKNTEGKFRSSNQTDKSWFFSKKFNALDDANKKAFAKKLYDSSLKDREIFFKVVDILRKGIASGVVTSTGVEAALGGMFGNMFGLGKAIAGPRFLPCDPITGKILTMQELYKMGLANMNDPGVLEHMKPADYIKGLTYNYIMTGKGLNVLKQEINSQEIGGGYDTSILPKRIDTILKDRGNESFMGINYRPGMSIFGPGQRYRGLGISFYDVANNTIVRSGLQFSRNSQQRQNLNKAIELARDPNKKEKGISVFDFDDTLAQTNSMVIVKMPDGKTMEIDATRFALESADLEAAGAIFDFSQFSQVIDGKKGPLFDLATRRQDKFTSKDIFVLTARPQEAAIAIHAFLKGMGLNIPMKNIVGLADGRPEAKSDWIIGKAAEGYNNFYFADDAYKNVKAVQDVLNQIDVKSDVQQAFIQFSRTMDESFNDILQETKGVKSETRFSDAAARARGAKKGNFFKNLFVPPSAEDFVGLLYSFLAKGKKGEQQMAFFEKALIKPFARAMQELASARQVYANGLRNIKKAYPDIAKRLAKPTKYNEFNHDTAIRAYIWNKLGYDIPGMSKTDIKRLTELVENDPGLKAFALDLMDLTQDRKYVQPGESWLAGNIATDIKDITDKVGRKEFLKQWIDNKNVIFSKENMNKIEAIYGSDFREALEDMLYRMENGTNRNFGGQSKLVNSFTNWVNNSVGAIMFFNIRSAVLQTLSMVNFVNWTDNNPVAAGAALLNVKQFAADFVTIFNSDMLKQRRRGIGRDINESEIAEAMYGKRNKPKAILNYLLRIGFTPTQIADSFAIAAGGASFYRNRIKTYMKKGISRAEAEQQAFADFAEISEKTQQSSRPDLISQQQAGPLGRLILAFQNTPMQYTRLIKKAFLDLVNGRGDMKTNISKIAYYGFVQNLIFASMQSAMFALMFSDQEDEEFAENKKERVANSMVDTLLRGTGVYGAGVATIKNMIKRFVKEEEKDFGTDHTYTIIEAVNLSPPVGSKLRKLYSGIQTYRFNKDLISHKGFALDNPAYQAGGNVVSALTNVPLDRLFNKMNNLRASMNNNNEAWQRIALALGWNTWDVDAELDPELDKLKEFLKKKRKSDQRRDPDYQKKRLEKMKKRRKEKIKKLKNK